MELPVVLPVLPSRLLAFALTLAHLLVAAALAAVRLPLPVKLVLGLFVALSLARSLRRRPVACLRLRADGSLELGRTDGDFRQARVLPSTTVFPWLIVLNLRTGTGYESLTLPVDALGAEGHRQLRLWLRWKASGA